MKILKTGLTFLTFAVFSIEALSGTLFTKNRYDEVYSYDTDTGSLIDHFPVYSYRNGGIAASADRLFVSDGHQVVAYTHDGMPLYPMDGYSDFESGVAYGDGKVFSTDGMDIFVTDAESGMILNHFSSMHGMLEESSFAYVPSTSEVPVPAAAWLFGTALTGLTVIRRRNKEI